VDKQYWEKFYSGMIAPVNPTPFARYFFEKYMTQGQCILDLGCGNGRDSVFFARHGLYVTGVDQCAQELARIQTNECEHRLSLVACDMSEFPQGKYHAIYSRFSLHAVSEATENILLAEISRSLAENGLLALEVRSTKDDLFGVGQPAGRNAFVTTHYRRFVDFHEIQEKIKALGFRIVEANESRGFAPYQNEDPVVIRVIALWPSATEEATVALQA
jgi:cyclopropane fatty-acyl-phospholipid synthase-like methyltransferase